MGRACFLLCKGMALPTCSVTTAVAKLSSALQGTVVAATCAWPQATCAAQTWMVISFLAKGRVASAVETPARLQAASVADRHTWIEVGGILPASTPSALSNFFTAMLHKTAAPWPCQSRRASDFDVTCGTSVVARRMSL